MKITPERCACGRTWGYLVGDLSTSEILDHEGGDYDITDVERGDDSVVTTEDNGLSLAGCRVCGIECPVLVGAAPAMALPPGAVGWRRLRVTDKGGNTDERVTLDMENVIPVGPAELTVVDNTLIVEDEYGDVMVELPLAAIRAAIAADSLLGTVLRMQNEHPEAASAIHHSVFGVTL